MVISPQPSNAYIPMLVTLFGIVMDLSDEQLVNAHSPILVTLFGILMDASELHSLNA